MTLELRQPTKYSQHQPAVGRGGVGQRIAQRSKSRTGFGNGVESVEQIALSMMIVLLAPPNVEGYYTASLLVRGFKAVTIPAVAPVLDFPQAPAGVLKARRMLVDQR